MELAWMAAITLSAVAVAIILTDRLETKLSLHIEVRDKKRLQKQLEELVDEGIRFAENCYCSGKIPLNQVKPLAADYAKSVLEKFYHTSVIGENGILEDLVEERLEEKLE